ncbi:MAG: putative membrane-bound dehydrogenase-like protein, partial [Verrucomicrobiales bacterium]
MRVNDFFFVAVISGLALVMELPASGGEAANHNPYWPDLQSPKLTTPQWIGEEGVEAVVVLSIDDMREPAKYEAFCRPILDRLKEIDGRAPLTIFTNTVDPGDPQIQAWLKEGLSIEVHTIDHPCPLLAKGDFAQAKKTVHDCIDLLAEIPGMKPVAYRMPCCDSMNSVSPRFFSEIFSATTESGNFLQIDSSVFNLMTPDDPDLSAELMGEGSGRLAKYVPKLRGYVNYIENYPYPYVIGGNCWQLPCVVPSDWEAQDQHGVNNPETVADMKAALDATVIKKGVFTLVFHPHGWIRNDQIVELIDHAVKAHGNKVKFLNMRDTLERLNKNFLKGSPLRNPQDGSQNSRVTVADVDGDGFMDASDSGDSLAGIALRDLDGDGVGERISGLPDEPGVFRKVSDQWEPLPFTLPYRTSIVTADGKDAGLRFADVNGDGHDDVIFSNHEGYSVHLWVSMQAGWAVAGLSGTRGDFPQEQEIPMIVCEDGSNNGVWFRDGRMFVQNEDTVRENTVVEQRSFAQLATALTKPEAILTMQPTAAADALETMRTHDRFEVQLVAAEPLVADPVDLAWGADGKLWVVEMGDYPQGEDGKGKPCGRVRYLEDLDGDGYYDKSTLFLDDLAYPSGVMPWKDGVLVLAAPNLLFARDANGDGLCDTREVLFDGFRTGNPQHLANGLAWGLDNWIYIANGDSGGEVRSLKTGKTANISGRDIRVRPDTGEIDAQSGMTQFSRPRDDWGNWFGCNNSYPLWHYVLHDHYLRRNPHVAAPAPDIKITEPLVHPQVYPASKTIERFNDYHTENRITSACGAGIYRDYALGDDVYGNAFICEPVHNLVYRQVLTADGYTFKARRADEEQQMEFLASTDNWFRPVTARTGPDGALYVVDMYRHVIEHPEWIPPEWEEKLALRAGHDRGRIYRVVKRGATVEKIPNLSAASSAELVSILESSNGELRDLAHQQLLQQSEHFAEFVEPLQKLAEAGARPASRLQALAVLDGLQKLGDVILRKALHDPAAPVRSNAVRLCEGRESLLNDLVALGTAESEPQVLLQLASSLGEFNSSVAGDLLASLLVRHGDSQWMQAAALSSATPHAAALSNGLMNQSPERLRELLPVLEKLVTLNKAVSSDFLLPQLVQGVAGKLAAIGQDAFPVVEKMIIAGVVNGIDPVIDLAANVAGDEQAESATRARAVSLLAAANQTQHLPQFESMLTLNTPAELQSAALNAISVLGSKNHAGTLLKRWNSFGPATRRALVAICLAKPDWTIALLDAAAKDAAILSGLTLSDRERLTENPVVNIRARATELFVNASISEVADYKELMVAAEQLQGNALLGKDVFTSQCSICHELEGIGQHVGPDLTSLTDRSFAAMFTG